MKHPMYFSRAKLDMVPKIAQTTAMVVPTRVLLSPSGGQFFGRGGGGGSMVGNDRLNVPAIDPFSQRQQAAGRTPPPPWGCSGVRPHVKPPSGEKCFFATQVLGCKGPIQHAPRSTAAHMTSTESQALWPSRRHHKAPRQPGQPCPQGTPCARHTPKRCSHRVCAVKGPGSH